MMKNNVRLVHLGQAAQLPDKLKKELAESMEMTAGNTGMVLALALNYGSRGEIIKAVKAALKELDQLPPTVRRVYASEAGLVKFTAGMEPASVATILSTPMGGRWWAIWPKAT